MHSISKSDVFVKGFFRKTSSPGIALFSAWIFAGNVKILRKAIDNVMLLR